MRQACTRVGRAHDEQGRRRDGTADTWRNQRDLHRWRSRRNKDVKRVEEVHLGPSSLPDPDLTQSFQRKAIVDNVSTLDETEPPVARLGSRASPSYRVPCLMSASAATF